MTNNISHLEAIISAAEVTIQKINKGENEKDALKTFNQSLDKNLIKIVTEFGGESYFYKGNNYSAWQLAMGEVE